MKSDNFQSLVERLQLRAETSPDEMGYTFLKNGTTEVEKLTYGQLDLHSREIAVMLQRVLKPDDRALLMYRPGLDFVSAFFGCLYAGVVAVPVYPPNAARPERSLPGLRSIAVEAGIDAILCTEKETGEFADLFQDVPELSECPLLATNHYGLERIDKWKPSVSDSDAIAFLQYTSGSTAAPKGVAVSHGNIIHNLGYIHDYSQHDTESILISWLPTYHDMGLFAGVLFPLFKGCPSYLMSPVSFLQKPIRWLQAISHFRGTNSGGPDFAYELCVQRSTAEQRLQLDLSSWQVAYSGAEPIRRSTLESFSATFRDCGFRRTSLFPVYGLAESTVLVSGQVWADERAAAAPPAHQEKENSDVVTAIRPVSLEKSVSCGSPRFGMEVIIADPSQLTEMPDGEIGEIWISGPSVAKGYWNRPEETNATFRAFLADTNQGPYLRTGDLGFMRAGELFVTGRIKDLIIIRGRKHYPQDIEQTVETSHSEIRNQCTAAVSVPTSDGERLAIVAEVNRRSNIRGHRSSEIVSCQWREELGEIIATIRQAVSEQHELQTTSISILARGSIPKTSSGKIRRHACCNAVLDGSLDSLAYWSLHPAISNVPSQAIHRDLPS